ncbi:ABC transporter substrate-binding protein [SCandidatus Aminicenantes bacterium Aminicenantia_JdfR_composite]|nr:ABC transporter substrate-binding protein [SCandidatus Aminicenantes bacterium Aminicenantia_JdfR_composite]MCP2605810.1 ABC transporter substrate-binding protein [Candidatus Aminicenantes bacterium AC-335-O07]
MKKYFTFLTLILLLACSISQNKISTLVITIENQPTNLDPRVGTDSASQRLHQIIFSGLLVRNERDELKPLLAEKWERINDRTFIFHLKRGIKFHNGKVLDSEDVKYTFQSFLDENFISLRKQAFNLLEKVEIIDKWTVKFVLKTPYSSFLINLTVGIVPKGAGEDFHKKPIGTGPFKFISLDSEKIVLEAFPDYFEGKPKIDRLIIRIIPDAMTRALELKKGSVDLGLNVLPPDLIRFLSKDKKLKILTAPGTTYYYLGINLRDPVLKNKKVRQAIAHAINRKEIISNIMRGFARPANSVLSPNNWAYEGNLKEYEYNPEKAKKLLDEAGYPQRGRKPRFKIVYKTSNSSFGRQLGLIIKDNLRKVGIDVEIKSYEFATFYSDIIKGNFLFTRIYFFKFKSRVLNP